MARQFDLIVLGTGVGASTVATRCREAGLEVAIVDARPYGGTCALRGCDPKKILVGAAAAVDAARRLAGKGVAGEAVIRWPELIRFERGYTDPIPPARERSYEEQGIATYHGVARFVGPTAVEVGGERLEARHVHVATGAKPVELPIPGAEHLSTSDDFLELDALPQRIVFIGSGYIAFEFAHVAATAGAEVTMLEQRARPLANFDAELVERLVARTRDMDIDLQVRTEVEALERRGDALLVRASLPDGPIEIEADMVVHSAGRAPNCDALGLDVAGVEHDGGGILVNAYMQSVSNPAVYAAGDVAQGGLPLTPVAKLEARVAAANILESKQREIDYPPTPSVVFTQPPLAAVGLREDEAREQGLRFETRSGDASSWYSARRVAEQASAYKILVSEDSDEILGAHLLGPHVEELINLFAMAMRCKLTTRDIEKMIFAYPTRGSDISHML